MSTTVPVSKYRFGYRRNKVDPRDKLYSGRYSVIRSLPGTVPVVHECPRYDQGPVGSCIGNGYAYQIESAFHLEAGVPLGFVPSRLGIYFGAREREGTTQWDAGAEPRDGMKAVVQDGVFPENRPDLEANWPYDVDKFAVKPPPASYAFGQLNQAPTYAWVAPDLCQIKSVLATGLPVGFGFTVYDSFMNVGKDGVVPMPDLNSEGVLGGHWVVKVGYDDVGGKARVKCPPRHAVVRNSWSEDWGDEGYCYMSYEFLLTYGADFSVVQTVE